ncbi:MAG: hypothetical protein ACREYE_10765 [Gammaproteobacteria bacterium]
MHIARLRALAIASAALPFKALIGRERQDFLTMDNLDTDRFNRVLWEELMGPDVPYPTHRHGRQLSRNRKALLGE